MIIIITRINFIMIRSCIKIICHHTPHGYPPRDRVYSRLNFSFNCIWISVTTFFQFFKTLLSLLNKPICLKVQRFHAGFKINAKQPSPYSTHPHVHRHSPHHRTSQNTEVHKVHRQLSWETDVQLRAFRVAVASFLGVTRVFFFAVQRRLQNC